MVQNGITTGSLSVLEKKTSKKARLHFPSPHQYLIKGFDYLLRTAGKFGPDQLPIML